MSAETTYSAYLEAVGRDLEIAARRQARMLRRRRARLRLAAIGVASIVLLAGSALAGAGILGGRAPDFVQTSLSSLWQDDGSRLAPTDGQFREVAIFDGDTLYRTPARDGTSVCLSVYAPASQADCPKPRSLLRSRRGRALAVGGEYRCPRRPSGDLRSDTRAGRRVPRPPVARRRSRAGPAQPRRVLPDRGAAAAGAHRPGSGGRHTAHPRRRRQCHRQPRLPGPDVSGRE